MQAAASVTPERRGIPIATWGIAALTGVVLAWSYAPSFTELIRRWDSDPNYSYGFFVIPIALVILWQRRDTLHWERVSPRWWGLVPLVAVLALRWWLYERNELWLEDATIPLVVASLMLMFGGPHLFWWSLPGVLFLFFMLPLPASVNAILAQPLQRLATLGSQTTLQALGMPVLAEGNILIIGGEQLEVARACNGLSMLLSFVTLITAVAILVQRPWWERAVLLASAIPIALVSNILRIVGTALCYYYLGSDVGERVAHDTAGWMMMPLALLFVWLELWVLSLLVVEDADDSETMTIFATTDPHGATAPVKKSTRP